MDKTSAASFCASQIDFIQSNAETYIQRVRDMVQQYAPTAGQIVAGSVSEFISNLAKLPMQSIVFLLLLFYFLRYEPRIRQEIWKLSPFSADETNALVYSLNEKVSKTIGQSLFKSTGGFLTTYLAFYVAHFDISLIFAFLAGALELTPFTSPWLIWAPSLVISILRDGITKYPFRWSIMLTLYLNDLFIVNRQIDLVLFDLRGMYI
jgi:predicted PurR-regulated permease PerM